MKQAILAVSTIFLALAGVSLVLGLLCAWIARFFCLGELLGGITPCGG